MRTGFLLAGCAVLLIIITSNAQPVTKVLQNGLNSYNSCFDSYLYRLGTDPSTFSQNFGNDNNLMTAN